MPVSCEIEIAIEILHFHPQWKLRKSIFFDRQGNGMTLSTGSFLSLGLKAVFGSCLEREKGRWLCLSVGFLWQFDQQVSSTVHRWRAFELF